MVFKIFANCDAEAIYSIYEHSLEYKLIIPNYSPSFSIIPRLDCFPPL